MSEIGEIFEGPQFGMSMGASDYGGCGGWRLNCSFLFTEVQEGRLGECTVIVKG